MYWVKSGDLWGNRPPECKRVANNIIDNAHAFAFNQISPSIFRETRKALGFDVQNFALLLGVNASTVYRWENQHSEHVRLEPLQLKLLGAITTILSRLDYPPDHGRTFIHELYGEILLGGTLKGLHCLLKWFFAVAPRHEETQQHCANARRNAVASRATHLEK